MWKKFSLRRVRSTSEPSATINRLGLIWLNRSASSRFGTDEVEFVEFFHDAIGNRIGIKPVEEQSGDSYRLSSLEQKGSRKVFAASFLKSIGYDLGETRRFPVRWEGRMRLLVIELGSGAPEGGTEDGAQRGDELPEPVAGRAPRSRRPVAAPRTRKTTRRA